MKKVLSIIFVCVILVFTSCADKTNNTEQYSAYETRGTEESMENTTEDASNAEMSDEEYLISLGKQLKLGMTEKEVIEKIGEPDDRIGSGLYFLGYQRGSCGLSVAIWPQENKVYEVIVHNDETDKTTCIYSIYDDETETTE
ncbi:MAG: hypothetical protein HDT13_02215 [Butyrivibrio sp.]|nr:hypothetical protein [Butyrivibrio sp.]